MNKFLERNKNGQEQIILQRTLYMENPNHLSNTLILYLRNTIGEKVLMTF